MKLIAKLKHKLSEIAVTAAYFAAWIGTLILLKTLVLQEYGIGFSGWSKVMIGALLLAKIVRWLDHIPLSGSVLARPAWVGVVLRTALYSAGLVLAMLLDAGFEGKEEHGGFMAALDARLETASFPHIVVNSICLTGAFFFYNVLTVLRLHLGGGSLLALFLKPLPPAPSTSANPN